MYSEILGMLQQDSFKEYRNYLDLMAVMPPSPNFYGGSGLDNTSKPQPPASTYPFLPHQQQNNHQHQTLSRRNSNPPPAYLPRQSSSSLDVSDSAPAPLPPVGSLLSVGGAVLHRRLDRSHSEPVAERKPAQLQASSRYKTELCRPFEESGQCKYGDKCQFAHGMHELRNMSRHPKYKTDLCRTFHTTGYCPYGARCHFVHNNEEQRRRRQPLGSAGEPISPASLSGSSSPSAMMFCQDGANDAFKSIMSPSPVPQQFSVFQFPQQQQHELDLLLTLPSSPSPADSLAGDLETMSLSSGGSASGSPPSCSPLDQPRHLRLPVFSRMRKDNAANSSPFAL